jgi:hypothetical protein
VRSIDASKKHPVTLTFLLDEEVTPQLFAQKIALACGGGALRPGEGILIPHSKIACVVVDETLSLPSFGYEWHRSPKKPKRPKLTRNRCR